MMGYGFAGPLAAYGWLGMAAMGLFWLGLLVLLVWVVSTVVGRRGESIETPLDILRRRFARGEITKDEFESTRHSLE